MKRNITDLNLSPRNDKDIHVFIAKMGNYDKYSPFPKAKAMTPNVNFKLLIVSQYLGENAILNF